MAYKYEHVILNNVYEKDITNNKCYKSYVTRIIHVKTNDNERILQASLQT